MKQADFDPSIRVPFPNHLGIAAQGQNSMTTAYMGRYRAEAARSVRQVQARPGRIYSGLIGLCRVIRAGPGN